MTYFTPTLSTKWLSLNHFRTTATMPIALHCKLYEKMCELGNFILTVAVLHAAGLLGPTISNSYQNDYLFA